ncbi:hypothetical protein [Hugonella massiliensis]|uniref:hypothetical protein n=1 Tax=Hugonella massiliensis TaxID=1720315 RepID=UPI00073E94C9|nr:hypothetical protein [Hugonella massiliensis]MDD6730591.1 UDP-N-acetylmuramoylalanyl-D-glutamate--2,6-diaminopimelate ligase [Eggerthellaceae bacterium]
MAIVTCPACGSTDFELAAFDSMMVLGRDLALFTLTCPLCGAQVSSVCAIPAALRPDVEVAARELGAGMGGKRTSDSE